VQLKRIGVSVFLLFSLTSPCQKHLICFEQEKKPPIKKKDVSTIEQDLFMLVNRARQTHDLAPVIWLIAKKRSHMFHPQAKPTVNAWWKEAFILKKVERM
jgi:hypothetical protein